MLRKGFVNTAAALTLVVAPAAGVLAQQEQIGDEELKSFAVVVLEVERISIAYVPLLEAAGSPEEQRKIATVAEAEVGRAISDQGMSMVRFQKILERAKADDSLAERVKWHMKHFQ